MNICVIGGGASGMMASIAAVDAARKQKKDVRVTIIEKNPFPGRKLLATGNGRCNFSNETIEEKNYRGDLKLFRSVYPQFNNAKTISFFRSFGLESFADPAGRVYPLSKKSESVLFALRYQCEARGVSFLCGTEISSIAFSAEKVLLNHTLSFDRLIIAAGGAASPGHGTDGKMFDLIRSLGIPVHPIYPALTALILKEYPKTLKGVRADGTVKICKDGSCLGEDSGELQFTEYGLSGIPAMAVSEYAAKNLHGDLTAHVELAPNLSKESLFESAVRFKKDFPQAAPLLFLTGLLPEKLARWVLQKAGSGQVQTMGDLTSAQLKKLIEAVKTVSFTVTGVKGFAFAQVTAGGVGSDAVNPETLQCKKYPGMFFCGEILDVNGDCGGYNLQWAWSSGFVAGKNCIK